MKEYFWLCRQSQKLNQKFQREGRDESKASFKEAILIPVEPIINVTAYSLSTKEWEGHS